MSNLHSFQLFFETCSNLIQSEEFKANHRLSTHDFCRERKLSFSNLIFFILSLPKKSLPSALDDFFSSFQYLPSKQAFSAARQKISHLAFLELFQLSAKAASSLFRKTWHGLKVLAVDGTTLQLPDTKENREYFGEQTSSGEPLAMARITTLYDVLNDILLEIDFGHYRSDERSQAKRFLLGQHKKSILLFDRGYPSRDLCFYLNNLGYYYLMRVSDVFLKGVNNCPLGDSRVWDIHQGKTLPLRVIRFQLNEQETETLITNLFVETVTQEMLKDLYFKRWGIESKYRELKSRLEIENFSGKKPCAILQDYYATLFMANLVSMFKQEADGMLRPKEEKEYQINRTYLIYLIRKKLLSFLLFARKSRQIIDEILEKTIKNRSQIRRNRKCKRKKKHPNVRFTQSYKSNL